MTAQARDRLLYNGEEFSLSTEPLKPLLDLIGYKTPTGTVVSSDCWRGYRGKWEIINEELFLIDLKGFPEENKHWTIDALFPNQKKVFAGWFTGEIIIPQGKMLHYEHMGYMSIFEKDLFLEFQKGKLINKREVDNTKKFDPNDPIGWGKISEALAKNYYKNLKKGDKS
jgi:hypothetical protein